MSIWRRCFEVAGFHVGVESECGACSRIIDDLTALYPPTEAQPDVIFTIARQHELIELRLNGRSLWQSEDSGEIVAGFEVYLYQQMVTVITPQQCSIHAACLQINDGAVIFAGESGAGKSTICTKGVLEGCAYLSDEFSLLGEDGRITPFPRPLQWGKRRHPAFTHKVMLESGTVRKSGFSFPAHGGGTIHATFWLPKNICRTTLPLRHVVLHQFDKKAISPVIEPIRRSQALLELPNHLHQRQQPAEMLQTLNRRIPASTTFHRFRYADIHTAWQLLMESLKG